MINTNDLVKMLKKKIQFEALIHEVEPWILKEELMFWTGKDYFH